MKNIDFISVVYFEHVKGAKVAEFQMYFKDLADEQIYIGYKTDKEIIATVR